MKKTETQDAVEINPNDAPPKKLVIVGLPSKAAAKSGFPGAAGQPGYRAKSSKATGAKKRVRQ